MSTKPRIIKDYDKLPIEIQEQVKLNYPFGFEKKLITFKNVQGKFVSALPYETDDRYYLIRMSRLEAQEIIEEDDDYDDDGNLKDDVREDLEVKYDDDAVDLDELSSDDSSDGDDE